MQSSVYAQTMAVTFDKHKPNIDGKRQHAGHHNDRSIRSNKKVNIYGPRTPISKTDNIRQQNKHRTCTVKAMQV